MNCHPNLYISVLLAKVELVPFFRISTNEKVLLQGMEECYCLGIITDRRDGSTKKQTDRNQPSDGHEGKLPLAPPKSQWMKG